MPDDQVYIPAKKMIDALVQAGTEVDDSLKRFASDEDMYVEYIRQFPEEPTMNTLREAVENNDVEAATKAVHSLKGLVGNLGLLPLYDAAVDMLTLLREGETDEGMQVFEDVEDEYQQICAVIKGVSAN